MPYQGNLIDLLKEEAIMIMPQKNQVIENLRMIATILVVIGHCLYPYSEAGRGGDLIRLILLVPII